MIRLIWWKGIKIPRRFCTYSNLPGEETPPKKMQIRQGDHTSKEVKHAMGSKQARWPITQGGKLHKEANRAKEANQATKPSNQCHATKGAKHAMKPRKHAGRQIRQAQASKEAKQPIGAKQAMKPRKHAERQIRQGQVRNEAKQEMRPTTHTEAKRANDAK